MDIFKATTATENDDDTIITPIFCFTTTAISEYRKELAIPAANKRKA